MTALAVVIVAHDSTDVLATALAALEPQLGAEDEVVVVDSGSSDDPAAVLPERVRLVDAGGNVGFAGGAALGAAQTSAPLVLFLNPDAIVEPGCLDALREAPADWAAWQALVLLPDGETVNTAGNVAHWTGLGWAGHCDSRLADLGLDGPQPAGFASGAALVVRRADWDAAGGFDPAYFMYGEDQDLSLRLRLAGRGVGIIPGARVVHGYDFAKGDYKWFHLERNRWWTVLSVYPAPLLMLVLPALLALEVALLFVAWRGGWLKAKLRAQVAVLRTLGRTRARRAVVQRTRRVSTGEFAAGLTAGMASPYLAVPPPAERAQAGYWRVVRGLLSRS